MRMNEEVRNETAGAADNVKLGVAIAVVLAGLVAFYALGAATSAWIRWLAVAGGIVVAIGVLALSSYGRGFRQFVAEARIELRKIVWPNRQETGMTTLVVFLFVIISGAFFWVLDLILAWATRALSGTGG
jgi:preprotein translocase subunit SecE